MIEVRKKEGEKFEALLRRFNRVVQTSGLLRTIKGSRFHFKPKTRRARREEAKRKMTVRKLRERRFV